MAGIQLAETAVALVEKNPAAAAALGVALLGAAIGTAVTRKSEGAMMGAVVGALAALLVNAYLTPESAQAHA